MTKEEIMEMNFEQVEERREAIVSEIETADTEALEALSEELDAIEERKAVLKREADEKREAMLEVLKGDGETVEEVKEDRKPMENIEIRKSPEYLTAWVSDALGHANAEQRALLSENATNGTVAVPAYVDDVIHTAWESNELLRRVRRTYYPGNLKVGYEISAPHAVAHTEGSAAITEEELQLGVITMIPKMIKKFVSYSDEAGDINENFARYIVDEVVDRVIKGVIDEGLAAMASSTLTSRVTVQGQSIDTTDLINAEAFLKGDASPVFVTTRPVIAQLKAAALSAQYGYDPFDGMEVVIVEQLPSGVGGFVADLSGVLVNFPQGDDVKIKVDDLTAAASDMVKVYGRLYAAIDVVAPGKVVKFVAA